MPYYAFRKGSRDPLKFDTKAAFDAFIDKLKDVSSWWFSSEGYVYEKLAEILVEMKNKKKEEVMYV